MSKDRELTEVEQEAANRLGRLAAEGVRLGLFATTDEAVAAVLVEMGRPEVQRE